MRRWSNTVRSLLLVMPVCVATSVEGAVIAFQGFEPSGDTWSFAATPGRYSTEATGDVEAVNGDEDVWGPVKRFTGDIDSPRAGTRFWGLQDLENSNGGGSFDHLLTFASVDVTSFGNVVLSLAYHAIGYDTGDRLGYEVFFDNVGQGAVSLVTGGVGGVSTNGWQTTSLAVPDSVGRVSLVLRAAQNGGDDFAGFDDISLEGNAITSVPEPASVWLLGSLALAAAQVRQRRREGRARVR